MPPYDKVEQKKGGDGNKTKTEPEMIEGLLFLADTFIFIFTINLQMVSAKAPSALCEGVLDWQNGGSAAVSVGTEYWLARHRFHLALNDRHEMLRAATLTYH